MAEVYYELTVVLELLAVFFSIIVFFLLFLKVFMGKDDKRVHLGAAGLSTLAGKKSIELFRYEMWLIYANLFTAILYHLNHRSVDDNWAFCVLPLS